MAQFGINTDRPDVLITFQGNTDEKKQLNLRNRLIDFRYEDKEKGADICTITLDNHDLSLIDDLSLRKGNILEITWGYAGNFAPPREIVIKRTTGFTQFKIEAYDKGIQFHKETKFRTFEKKTRSQIVQQIAEENGFGIDVQDIEDTGEVHGFVHQAKQTDAQFVKRLAEKEGFQWYIDFDGFHFHQRRLGQKPTRAFRYYHDQERGEILTIDSVDTNIAAKGGAIRLRGRDTLRKKNIDARANNQSAKRDTLANVIEIVDPESGNTRTSRRNASEQVQTTAQQSEQAAKREAEARFRNTQLSAVKLKFTVMGDPSILAKSIVILIGISKLLSGPYYVSKVIHIYDSKGYRTQLETKRDGVSEFGPESKGDKNRKKPDGKGVRAFEKVSKETGKTDLQFRDSKGRTVGVSGQQTK